MIFNPDYSWQSEYLFDYDVTSYIIDIEVSDTTTHVGGNVTINCIALIPLDTFTIFSLLPAVYSKMLPLHGKSQTCFLRYENHVLHCL